MEWVTLHDLGVARQDFAGVPELYESFIGFVIFEWELADVSNVSFNVLPLLLPVLGIVLRFLVVDALQECLILHDNLDEFLLPVA